MLQVVLLVLSILFVWSCIITAMAGGIICTACGPRKSDFATLTVSTTVMLGIPALYSFVPSILFNTPAVTLLACFGVGIVLMYMTDLRSKDLIKLKNTFVDR